MTETIPAWEELLLSALTYREERVRELEAVPVDERDWWWRVQLRDAQDRCRWQRDLIAEIKRFDEGT